MKTKLLPIILFLLILLNGFLIFMLINKPHEKSVGPPEKSFLAEKLQFSEKQTDKFLEFDRIHRDNMMEIQHNIKEQKDVLFNFFKKEEFNLDSLTHNIGMLEAKKETEIFTFFNKVRSLCTKEQTIKFDKIIKSALKGGERGNRPPRGGDRNRPPGDEEMPPPPPR